MRISGKILSRSKKDPAEITIHEDYAEMVLYDWHNNPVGKTLIDLDDVKKLQGHRWFININGYVGTRMNGKSILLHRYVMGVPDDTFVDHAKHNTLDNRKSKLRACTNQQNCCNKLPETNTLSGRLGVGWDKRRNKWHVQIEVNGKNNYLGCYTDINEAIRVRELAELKFFGEFAPLFNNHGVWGKYERRDVAK
jgi:hypothetical protein